MAIRRTHRFVASVALLVLMASACSAAGSGSGITFRGVGVQEGAMGVVDEAPEPSEPEPNRSETETETVSDAEPSTADAPGRAESPERLAFVDVDETVATPADDDDRDRADPEPAPNDVAAPDRAAAAEPEVTEPTASGPSATESADAREGTDPTASGPSATEPADAPEATEPADAEDVETGAEPIVLNNGAHVDWAPFERAIIANHPAVSPSVDELRIFSLAAVTACTGQVTTGGAGDLSNLSAEAEQALNRIVPAQCYLVPGDPATTAGPIVGASSWGAMVETRHAQTAGWSDVDSFAEAAAARCAGADRDPGLGASTNAQLDAIVDHGECELAGD